MISKNRVTGLLFVFFCRPITTLSAAALLIVASTRLSFAIVAAINVFLVYTFTVLTAESLKKIRLFKQSVKEIRLFPTQSESIASLFLASFAGSLFFLGFYCLAPILALETVFISLFVPVYVYMRYAGKKRIDVTRPGAIKRCLSESLYLGLLTIVLALIREPLGYATLSLPGGAGGITTLFNQENNFPLAVEIVSWSTGAFLLIGLVLVIFRSIDRRKANRT